MADWPGRESRWGTQTLVISHAHPLSLGPVSRKLVGTGSSPASTAWPAANRAILIPFRLPKIMTAYQMIVGCGTTAAGNFDCGIYDKFGNLLVSGGTTVKPATSEAIVNITDTVLGRGTYYMALSADGTNNYIATAPAQAALVKAVGIRQASSAFVLPATITFETAASAFIPVFGVVFTAT